MVDILDEIYKNKLMWTNFCNDCITYLAYLRIKKGEKIVVFTKLPKFTKEIIHQNEKAFKEICFFM